MDSMTHVATDTTQTGCGKDYPTVWGAVSDVFTRIKYEPKHELRAAVEATGHTLEEIHKM